MLISLFSGCNAMNSPGSLQINRWWEMLFQRSSKENFVICLRNQKGLGDLTSEKRQLSHHQPQNNFVLKASARTISVLPSCIPPLISHSLKKNKKSNWMKKLEKEWNPVCLPDTLGDTVAMVTSSTTKLLYLWFFSFFVSMFTRKKNWIFVPSSSPV